MLALLACVIAAAAAASARAPPALVDVFRRGDGGYFCFRIPAMVAPSPGKLLLFAEARRGGCADADPIDLVSRASSDGGVSWGPLSVVLSQGTETVGNPAPVVLASGRILLPYCVNNKAAAVLASADGGATWAAAGALPMPPTWSRIATGPPGSLVLASGRVLVPADHNEGGKASFSHTYFSDDGGATWAISSSVVGGNEAQAAAMPWLGAKAVLLSMRSTAHRLAARSDDGGATWGAPWPTLTETPCEGSTVALPAHPAGPRLVLSSAFTAAKRQNLTLHISSDDGHTWRPVAQVYAGAAAYSSLVPVADGAVAVAFERDGYEAIAVAASVAV